MGGKIADGSAEQSPIVLLEESDGGDAGSAGGDAAGGIVSGYASESEHGHMSGGSAGLGEQGEAGTGKRFSAGKSFAKNRGKDDEVSGKVTDADDIRRGMARNADDGRLRVEGVAGCLDRVVRSMGAQMHSISTGGVRQGCRPVDQNPGRGRVLANGGYHGGGEFEEISGSEILFANLNELNPAPRPGTGLVYKAGKALRQGCGRIVASGDGAEKHLMDCMHGGC
jgi:hypothetical protein